MTPLLRTETEALAAAVRKAAGKFGHHRDVRAMTFEFLLGSIGREVLQGKKRATARNL